MPLFSVKLYLYNLHYLKTEQLQCEQQASTLQKKRHGYDEVTAQPLNITKPIHDATLMALQPWCPHILSYHQNSPNFKRSPQAHTPPHPPHTQMLSCPLKVKTRRIRQTVRISPPTHYFCFKKSTMSGQQEFTLNLFTDIENRSI